MTRVTAVVVGLMVPIVGAPCAAKINVAAPRQTTTTTTPTTSLPLTTATTACVENPEAQQWAQQADSEPRTVRRSTSVCCGMFRTPTSTTPTMRACRTPSKPRLTTWTNWMPSTTAICTRPSHLLRERSCRPRSAGGATPLDGAGFAEYSQDGGHHSEVSVGGSIDHDSFNGQHRPSLTPRGGHAARPPRKGGRSVQLRQDYAMSATSSISGVSECAIAFRFHPGHNESSLTEMSRSNATKLALVGLIALAALTLGACGTRLPLLHL